MELRRWASICSTAELRLVEGGNVFKDQGVQHGYDRWAAVYDEDANPLQALERPHFQDACGDVAGLTVLDLGCGTGRHTQWLADGGATVTAVDFSKEMLAKARCKLAINTVRFLVHDIHERFPLKQGEFDLVISGLVLEHLRDLNELFVEIHRVLKQSGRVVVSAMHPAMFLRDSQAQFTDPQSGEVIRPGSLSHQLGEMIMAGVNAKFHLTAVEEYAPNREFAAQYPRAEKYIGWPMLTIICLSK